jgi:hypothetical protein
MCTFLLCGLFASIVLNVSTVGDILDFRTISSQETRGVIQVQNTRSAVFLEIQSSGHVFLSTLEDNGRIRPVSKVIESRNGNPWELLDAIKGENGQISILLRYWDSFEGGPISLTALPKCILITSKEKTKVDEPYSFSSGIEITAPEAGAIQAAVFITANSIIARSDEKFSRIVFSPNHSEPRNFRVSETAIRPVGMHFETMSLLRSIATLSLRQDIVSIVERVDKGVLICKAKEAEYVLSEGNELIKVLDGEKTVIQEFVHMPFAWCVDDNCSQVALLHFNGEEIVLDVYDLLSLSLRSSVSLSSEGRSYSLDARLGYTSDRGWWLFW